MSKIIIILLLILVIILTISHMYKDWIQKYRKKDLDFKNALINDEFDIYIQPKYNLKNESIVGAECLVRWNSKSKGVISPEKFIYILEKDKSIIELDFYILNEAFKIINRWSSNGLKLIPISVNISRITLIEDDTFITRLNYLIKKYNIDTKYLEIELTERIMLRETSKIVSVIKKIRDLGIKVSLDDFGAGYSSLNILKNLPVDAIKLDKLFLDKKDISEKGKIVIENIINMARALGLEVVAEGVEYFEQAKILKSIGCEIVQGYLYGRPMSISEFEQLETFNKNDYIKLNL
ncbi:EAL domain-containing protein [Clostridium sp.]|uniref:EAL domain-containing protein n=1 Tax=Clostridium sp. TaxID=1506 RepID=UPI0025B887AF|nr:EAL domain-containing protein [Clostridium sp.]